MKDDLAGIWRGATVVCAASGPSLALADLEFVRGYKARVIATNSTAFLAPWADAAYAMDTAWWKASAPQMANFTGLRLGLSATCTTHGATLLSHRRGFVPGNNSGAGAIGVALYFGAARILLLGYDGQLGPNGEAHWHPDHPKPLGNGASIKGWRASLVNAKVLADKLGVPIVNCSRATAYEFFPRSRLEVQLSALEQAA